MGMKKFTLTAAGDMLIQRRIPDGYEGLSELADFIGQGDASFFNLESTINDGSGWATSITAARICAPIPACWTMPKNTALT